MVEKSGAAAAQVVTVVPLALPLNVAPWVAVELIRFSVVTELVVAMAVCLLVVATVAV